VRFEYLAAEDRYQIEVPGFAPGQLRTLGHGGSYDPSGWQTVESTWNTIAQGSTASNQPVNVLLAWPKGPLNPDVRTTYTGWGYWTGETSVGTLGYFAYGIPTAASNMPVSGQARYEARVIGEGLDSASYIDGTAQLQFDFSAGKLSGFMEARYCPWDCIALPRYDFAETVYGVGSREFSGRFAVPSTNLDSAFSGTFNGPAAAEVMASWKAPFLNPDTKKWEQMMGIWLGTRGQ
jgi:hypothetical protein